jgi:DNA-binding helix-hairpin-helix protein with protein kinase domain
MSPTTIFHNGRPLPLDPADLLQAGGEGMVFALGSAQAAKVYHQPTAAQRAKLQQWMATQMGGKLPAAVLGPQELLHNQQGEIVGFTMRRLPGEARPFKKLGQPTQQPPTTLAQRVAYLQHIHTTLTTLHQQGLIVGDLNDHNLFYLPSTGQTAWVDVDSYQWSGFPCPVALQTFLDPYLYPVADFGQQPVFSEGSDWYAFFVLLVKTLLYAHPYGGVHHAHKTLLVACRKPHHAVARGGHLPQASPAF